MAEPKNLERFEDAIIDALNEVLGGDDDFEDED